MAVYEEHADSTTCKSCCVTFSTAEDLVATCAGSSELNVLSQGSSSVSRRSPSSRTPHLGIQGLALLLLSCQPTMFLRGQDWLDGDEDTLENPFPTFGTTISGQMLALLLAKGTCQGAPLADKHWIVLGTAASSLFSTSDATIGIALVLHCMQ